MGRIEEIAKLINNGQNLLEMQAAMQVTLHTILDYLRRAYGRGLISRAEIYFAIPSRHRALFFLYETYHVTPIYKQLKAFANGEEPMALSAQDRHLVENAEKLVAETFNVTLAELPWGAWDQELYKAYREFSNEDFLRADLYQDIATLEIKFNRFIRDVLVKHFGKGEDGWWRKGLKADLRADLVSTREMDEDPAEDAFCYLNFIHIKVILESNWSVFSGYFSKEIIKDKKKLLGPLTKINSIRNQVMHPIKNARHTYADFELIHTCLRDVEAASQKV